QRHPHSFPTRRSSDLPLDFPYLVAVVHRDDRLGEDGRREARCDEERDDQDGKKPAHRENLLWTLVWQRSGNRTLEAWVEEDKSRSEEHTSELQSRENL